MNNVMKIDFEFMDEVKIIIQVDDFEKVKVCKVLMEIVVIEVRM